MAIPIKRTMTLKSKLMSSKFRDHTLEELIIFDRQCVILRAYYFISNVDFTQEVKDLLKLTPEYEIEKPGSESTRYMETIRALYPKDYRREYNNTPNRLEHTLEKYKKLTSETVLTKAK